MNQEGSGRLGDWKAILFDTDGKKQLQLTLRCGFSLLMGFTLAWVRVLERGSPFALGWVACSGSGLGGVCALIGAALGYNGGRMISYTVLGTVFGALGTVLTYTLSMKSMLFTMLGLVVALLGLNMWGLLPALPSVPGEQNAVCRLPDKFRRQTPLLVGLLTGLMPCGALYAAWLCAMSSGSAARGAQLMLAFALGTVPLMLLFASLGALLPRGWTKYLRKLGAVLVTSMGLKMLIGGLLLLRG